MLSMDPFVLRFAIEVGLLVGAFLDVSADELCSAYCSFGLVLSRSTTALGLKQELLGF